MAFLVCLQVTTHPQTSTGWLLVVLLPLAFWHVLSFFVVIAYLSARKLTLWRLGSLRGGAILLWFVLASSLLVSLIGSRAYRSLLEDVLANHLPGQATLALLIISSVLLATCFYAVPVRLWRKVRALCLSHINVVVAIIFFTQRHCADFAVATAAQLSLTGLRWLRGNFLHVACWQLGFLFLLPARSSNLLQRRGGRAKGIC